MAWSGSMGHGGANNPWMKLMGKHKSIVKKRHTYTHPHCNVINDILFFGEILLTSSQVHTHNQHLQT